MTSSSKFKAPASAIVLLAVIFSACGPTYRYQPLPAQKPASYPGHFTVGPLQMAVHYWDDQAEARRLFGFDPRRAGVTPVQLVVENPTEQPLPLNIVAARITDRNGRWWEALPKEVAHQRISQYTKGKSNVGRNIVKYALAGAAVGMAWAVTGDSNVAAGLGKGIAIGAATGAVVSAAQDDPNSPLHEQQVAIGLERHGLSADQIPPRGLKQGIMFFPGETDVPQSISLTLQSPDFGKNQVRTFEVNFSPITK